MNMEMEINGNELFNVTLFNIHMMKYLSYYLYVCLILSMLQQNHINSMKGLFLCFKYFQQKFL